MNDTKKLLVALTLSMMILALWQIFYVNPRAVEAQKLAEQAQAEQQKADLLTPSTQDITALKQDVTKSPALLDRKEAIQEEGSRIPISTAKLHGSIALKGARFDDLILGEYKQENHTDSDDVVLLSPSGTKDVYFAEFGWTSPDESVRTPASDTVWYTEDKELTSEHPVTLSWDNNQGLKFFMTLSVDDHYMFTITRSIENYGDKKVFLLPYGLLNRSKDMSGQSYYILHEGALGVLDNTLTEARYKDIKKEKKQSFMQSKGWLGITDKYWLTAFIPDKENSFDANFNYFYRNGQDRFQVDYLGQPYEVKPGSNKPMVDHFFAGAKKLSLLEEYSKTLDIKLFDHAVDFGKLYFITQPIFHLLTLFNHLLGNFGLAILLLTVVIKAIMFPLANKSYISMQKMKNLQPRLLELKERYGNDKIKMHQEMKAIYAEEKVNPMSGCLPMLIQIPVFFALYKVLFVTIEMRHAPFYFWITDLSSPDPSNLFTLFGLIPWDAPTRLHIGILPIAMGITMFLQQKMNPAPTDPAQALTMKLLPFLFVFLFASFPAGLVIYWVWNNSLSILQQWIITRKLAPMRAKKQAKATNEG